MGFGQYKVDVLHCINPHLIWALIQKEGDENSFYFEQIGIYGILPQNITFGEDSVIKYERCEQWMPAASVALRRCFQDADHACFSPTYIDKQYSIFDENIHKYGELIVIKKNGEQVNVLDEIVNSEFALEDEYLFQQELRANNLKTQLGYSATHAIMSKIEEALKVRDIPKHVWMVALNNQTSVFREVKKLESSKSPHKLEVCDGDDAFLKTKLNVSRVCKGVDEMSVGRGCGRSNLSTSSVVSVALRKKLEWLESQSIHKHGTKDGKSEASDNVETISSLSPTKPVNVHADDVTNAIHSDKKTNDDDQENNNMVSPKNKNHSTEDYNTVNIRKGKIPWKHFNPEKTLVTFGPPGLPPNKFAIKEQPTREEKEEPKEEKRKPSPEEDYEVKKDQDVYADVDSEVHVPRHIQKRAP